MLIKCRSLTEKHGYLFIFFESIMDSQIFYQINIKTKGNFFCQVFKSYVCDYQYHTAFNETLHEQSPHIHYNDIKLNRRRRNLLYAQKSLITQGKAPPPSDYATH